MYIHVLKGNFVYFFVVLRCDLCGCRCGSLAGWGCRASRETVRMFCSTSETECGVGPVKLVWAPSGSLLTVPGRWFCFGSLLPVFVSGFL